MTLQGLANIAQLIGVLAVMVSLFYVGSQIRQDTSAVRSSTARAVHDNYASLPEVERARMLSPFMAFLSYTQNAFYQWRDGSLSPQLWVG